MAGWFESLDPQEVAEILIVSGVSLEISFDADVKALDVSVAPTDNEKCGRCWRHLPEVPEEGALCARCDEVVNG
jgi:isoleucyl-tRNA synthetase